MSQEQTETNDNLEYVLMLFVQLRYLTILFARAKMNMADVICLAVHLYSLVGKQCTSGISEDMRFQVLILSLFFLLTVCVCVCVCVCMCVCVVCVCVCMCVCVVCVTTILTILVTSEFISPECIGRVSFKGR